MAMMKRQKQERRKLVDKADCDLDHVRYIKCD